LDPIVPARETRRWQELLSGAGVQSEYVEYTGIRHNAWDVAYRDGAIFDWFGRHTRVRFPERVVFSTDSYRHGSAYWVRFDVLTPGITASIDARFTAKKKVEIETKALDAFTLQLKGHPMNAGPGPLTIAVNGFVLSARAGVDAVSLERGPKGWQIVRVPAQVAKRAGAEGPIADALSTRHIYVYGTLGTNDADEVQRRRAVAQEAAEWSTAKLRLLLTFRTVADADITPADLRNANLFLFGTKETNSIIRKYSDVLPLGAKCRRCRLRAGIRVSR
jgi:hypothetical protein